jgi:pantetheine-phosphate adenylyltransferase
MTKAIYAGSFDPITNGHEDLIRRASLLFDELVVAIGRNGSKKYMFSELRRKILIESVVDTLPNATVTTFEGLLVDYAKSIEADVIVRGLRMFSDFESEFQMALTNRSLNPRIETVFLTPQHEHSFVSSSMVKEVWNNGGDISNFVPEDVRIEFGRLEHGVFV